MPTSLQFITPETPLGAQLVPGGATFRLWAPQARQVYLALKPTDPAAPPWVPGEEDLLVRDEQGVWSGYVPGVTDGTLYRFYTVGAEDDPEARDFKRDPRARELEFYDYPHGDCLVRPAHDYPWHDAGFRPPAFHEFVIYQLHVGVFYASDGTRDIRKDRVSKFLDVVDRLEYLVALGVNAIQPLPVVEWQGPYSRGYNGTDVFSPEMDYCVPEAELSPYLARVNALFRKKRLAPLRKVDLLSQTNQLKAFIDLCHVYGLAVLFDVVYNHAGGNFDAQSMRFLDWPRPRNWWDADSYFQAGAGWAGGRVFAYATPEVREFLIDNARLFFDEYHVDGFRFDEVSVIADHGGHDFCRDLTRTLRYHKPGALQIAEYWNWDRAAAVTPTPEGLGFDAALHDELRLAVRTILGAASTGAGAYLHLGQIRDALRKPAGFPAAWRAVIHLENHDLVDGDREPGRTLPRLPALADGHDPRSWWARSRVRAATGLLFTAPGIPLLFMGQEFLEAKPWHNDPARSEFFIDWGTLDAPGVHRDFLRFTRDLIALRRRYPALCGEGLNAFYAHDADRVLAYHRWVEGVGQDVLVVVSFYESPHWNYELPVPRRGHWREIFNSDAYESMPSETEFNPNTVGNYGGITAGGPPRGGLETSSQLTIPANGVLVFAWEGV